MRKLTLGSTIKLYCMRNIHRRQKGGNGGYAPFLARAGKVQIRDQMSLDKRYFLVVCKWLCVTITWRAYLERSTGLQRLRFSRLVWLEWGPVICISHKFPGPDAASPDYALETTALGYPESIHPQSSLYTTAKAMVFLHYILQWLPFAYRERTSSRSGYCLYLQLQHFSYWGLTDVYPKRE